VIEAKHAAARRQLEELERSIDWPRLVALALADPPRPEELARRVREWAHTFARAYDGPPLLADYPEQVSKFFVKIGAVAVLRGRPCKDEATIAAAARAWEGAVYRMGYEERLKLAQIERRLGFLIPGEKPSEAVYEEIADEIKDRAGFGLERLKQVIKQSRKNSK
jgi:hypothetical protein